MTKLKGLNQRIKKKESVTDWKKTLKDFWKETESEMIIVVKKIKLETISDIKEFVNVASRYGDSLALKSGNYIVPACSIMSVISLDLTNPVKLCFDESIISAIMLDFKEWIVNE